MNTNVLCHSIALLGLCYRKTSHISRTLVGNKIVDNSDVADYKKHSNFGI